MAVMRMSGRLRTSATVATGALLALGLGAAVPAAAAPGGDELGVISNAGAEGTIAGSYIVILEDSAFSASSAQAEALADRHDAKVTSVYRHVLNGFAAEMSEADALALAADPAVRTVALNQTVEVAGVQAPTPSWGIDRIDQGDLPLDDSYTYPDHEGAGVTAYIVDTGIRYSHEDFGGRATFGWDSFGGTGNDGHGHGTHVAGTVAGASYGVAKAADLVGVKVLNDSGSGTTQTVVDGLEYVTADADGPSVVNMSLGGPPDAILDEAVTTSIEAGVTYAVAAGNNYGADAAGGSPSRVEEAITVASSTSTDAVSDFSNIGGVVDIFGPGSAITSAWATSDTAENTISGTSMATPHVAGAAALHLSENPTATPAQVEAHLQDTAVWNRLSGVPGSTVNALLHTGDEGGAPEPPDGPRFENGTDVPIADLGTAESSIDVTGAGVLDGAFQVEIDITHTYIGDLTVEVTAPDGSVRRLHDQGGGGTDNLVGTYTLNGTGIDADGTWTLRVEDLLSGDQGRLNGWALQL
ncbi:S8 family serine peptidase [Streptomyces sp. SBT349]|uniref:S8 family serine peptidase n=1 Tax=Streptomyces sp. SBT349 TaxID=1580539 RepID=UPI00066B6F8D|nr:S8 family serine peptidase [Streptomyces sp. SBT349]